ncbi:uncharacterized protein LOC130290582 isoform X2 [Hyla sarda]|uniref:uncharacterized protein LOC130290582 isoform X2 n=1 Tax=Hyla sarda TaxID=327740 RepID=UPI0024C3CDFA|nr:uncharacterized protein LOC130290582 isoform X2 [Hyla sarda]
MWRNGLWTSSALKCFSCSGECEDKTTKDCAQDDLCMVQEVRSEDGKTSDRQMGCQNSQYCKNEQMYGNIIQKCCDKDMCNDPKMVMADTSKPVGASDVSRETNLRCYMCDFPCVTKSETTCKNQEVCVTKTGRFGGVDYRKRGCANTTVCNTDTPENMAGSTFSARNKCCNTNLCNSAVHLKVPAVGILAAIVAVWISKL